MKCKKGFSRLLVSNFEACFLFYREILGFDVVRGDEKSGDADFKAGDMIFGLFQQDEMAEIVGSAEKPLNAECQDKAVLVFEVEKLDEVYQELKHLGVTFATEPMSKPYWGIKTAYFRDPDGNLLGIYEFMV